MSRIDQLKQLLADEPEDVFLNFGLAMEYAQSDEGEAALALFDRVLALDGGYCAAYVQKAQVLIGMGRGEEARGVITAGLEVAEGAGEGHTADKLRDMLQVVGG